MEIFGSVRFQFNSNNYRIQDYGGLSGNGSDLDGD
jgi:hypothetical protein